MLLGRKLARMDFAVLARSSEVGHGALFLAGTGAVLGALGQISWDGILPGKRQMSWSKGHDDIGRETENVMQFRLERLTST
jgi:hypothetical protein